MSALIRLAVLLVIPGSPGGLPDSVVAVSPDYLFYDGFCIPTECAATEVTWSGWSAHKAEERPEPWSGDGWFRYSVTVDSLARDRPLGIRLELSGALAIYLDGDLIQRFGDPSEPPSDSATRARFLDPIPIVFHSAESGPSSHVLTFHYNNRSFLNPVWTGRSEWFAWEIDEISDITQYVTETTRRWTFHQMLLTGFGLAFALVHLAMWLFDRERKGHLIFALLALASAALVFLDIRSILSTQADAHLFDSRALYLAGVLIMITLVGFVYSMFYSETPLFMYVFAAVGIGLAIWSLYRPFAAEKALSVFALVGILEYIRILIFRRKRRPAGHWILQMGVLVLAGFALLDVLVQLGVMERPWDAVKFPDLRYATLAILASVSVYLGRSAGQTRKRLISSNSQLDALTELAVEQEVEKAALEAMTARTAAELERARRLQLSMLPEQPPLYKCAEIAAFSRTASEVGGDYYDFHTSRRDGSLTIAIGDATGHGMQAGIMVTATKALFMTHADNEELISVIRNSSGILRGMGISDGMYMAMAVARLSKGTLEIVGAGMPPVLIVRARTGELETIEAKGAPLGSFVTFPYKKTETQVESGDLVLFMSDGFPETFNDEGEMYGYENAIAAAELASKESAAAMIEDLVMIHTDYLGSAQRTDDVTFVALKINSS